MIIGEQVEIFLTQLSIVLFLFLLGYVSFLIWYEDVFEPWARKHPGWWKMWRQAREKKKRLSLDDMADVPLLGITLGDDGEIESIGKCT